MYVNTLKPYINNIEGLETTSDEVLVGKILVEKNTLIFDVLYQRYEEDVFNKCLNFLKSRELAFQSTIRIFSEVFQNINEAKGHTFSFWLYSLTYTTCVAVINENKKIETHADVDREMRETHIQIEVGTAILFQMKANRLAKAIELIDPEDKAILLLRYQDDVSELEMESLFKVDSQEIKSRLRKAKARIIETYNEL
jgi:RNA polymerase sigma-70 factor (ECF subfamily)